MGTNSPRERYDVIKQSKAPKNAGTKVTFVLPAEEPAGPVSVVGDFNGWTPGHTVLRKRSNGTRSASVVVQPGSSLVFRYLGVGATWFDDPDASPCHEGGLVRA